MRARIVVVQRTYVDGIITFQAAYSRIVDTVNTHY